MLGFANELLTVNNPVFEVAVKVYHTSIAGLAMVPPEQPIEVVYGFIAVPPTKVPFVIIVFPIPLGQAAGAGKEPMFCAVEQSSFAGWAIAKNDINPKNRAKIIFFIFL